MSIIFFFIYTINLLWEVENFLGQRKKLASAYKYTTYPIKKENNNKIYDQTKNCIQAYQLIYGINSLEGLLSFSSASLN